MIEEVGFSGTRVGMNDVQKRLVGGTYDILGIKKVHHGDCVGADEDMHNITRKKEGYIILHPPTNPRFRAYCDYDEIRPELPYLERNDQIVYESKTLIATPRELIEQRRSGTWYTIRQARKRINIVKGYGLIIVYPNGDVFLSDALIAYGAEIRSL